MIKQVFICAALLATAVTMSGCMTPTTRIDIQNDRGPQVAGIDYRDLQEAANAMLQSLFKSGRLDRTDGGQYVLTVGRVTNDTTQRLDTDTLTSYIAEELMNSGKVMVTSAMAASAANRDEMVNAARSVRGNSEFNQATVAKQGQLVAPTHSIYGKIVQRQVFMDNGDKQFEYYFQLRIVEIASGLQWWQKQYVIGKRADASVTPR